MKKFKYALTLAGLMAASVSFSQITADQKQAIDDQVVMLQRELSLTPAQAEFLRKNLEEGEMKAADSRELIRQTQEQVDAIMDKSYTSFSSELDEDQMRKFKELKAKGSIGSGCSGSAKGACCSGSKGRASAAPASRESSGSTTKMKNSIR